MSKEKLLPPIPNGWEEGSRAMDYYLKVATRNTRKDVGSARRKAILNVR